MTSEPTPSSAARIENDALRVEYLTEAGPRIVGLYLKGSELNLLGTAPSLGVETPYGTFNGIGGHRLWHSPESFPRTYIPDNSGLVVEKAPGKVSLIGPVEEMTGMQKTITIELPEHGSQMTLRHVLQNLSAWTVEMAPWAITMLPMGGVAILPDQPAGAPQTGLLPDRHWSLWPYSNLQDPRFEPYSDYILLHAKPAETAFKIGYANKTGWVAYYFQGTLLVKRFDPLITYLHPDFGCNAESYVKTEFLELETLGPLARIEPGESVQFTEAWQIYTGLDAAPTIQGLRAVIQTLGLNNS
jgi:hypothetical protein